MHEKNMELAHKAAHVLSDLAAVKAMAQGFHWNVMGETFTQYHDFFQEIYEDLDGSFDPLAESILKLGFDAPYMLSDFVAITCVESERVSGEDGVRAMLDNLRQANDKVLACYTSMFELADECNEQGFADFIGGRIDMHKKWSWQLKASLGIR